jgi:3'5'-cyclic nucleotide phosphodiesterase
VPNAQLVKEGTIMAQIYNGKSVAEQNSVNVAWDLLLQDKYAQLRSAICVTQEEEIRFRQLVVNAVMATDIMDKDLKKLRDDRWKRAFEKESDKVSSCDIETSYDDTELMDNVSKLAVDRKATIVIEHLLQASDVAHTMQHWHIYRKWNERLFREMHKAYMEGRAETNPADFWYKGEIGFFDFYIVPLAKKLSDCGVFGVSSDEYLNYAIMNRNEWEKKGKGIVVEMLDKMAQEAFSSSLPGEDSRSTDSTGISQGKNE